MSSKKIYKQSYDISEIEDILMTSRERKINNVEYLYKKVYVKFSRGNQKSLTLDVVKIHSFDYNRIFDEPILDNWGSCLLFLQYLLLLHREKRSKFIKSLF